MEENIKKILKKYRRRALERVNNGDYDGAKYYRRKIKKIIKKIKRQYA